MSQTGTRYVNSTNFVLQKFPCDHIQYCLTIPRITLGSRIKLRACTIIGGNSESFGDTAFQTIVFFYII